MRPKTPLHLGVKCSQIELKAPQLHGPGETQTGLISTNTNSLFVHCCCVAAFIMLLVKSYLATKQLDPVCIPDWPMFRCSFFLYSQRFSHVCFLTGLCWNIRQQKIVSVATGRVRPAWRELQDPALTSKRGFLQAVAWEDGKINLCVCVYVSEKEWVTRNVRSLATPQMLRRDKG